MQQNIIDMGRRGRRTAAQLARDRAAYLAAPNRCLTCNAPILPRQGEKLSETMRRKFCARSCAASYNNSLAVAPKKRAKPRHCAGCGTEVASTAPEGSRILCPACYEAYDRRLPALTRAQSTSADRRAHMRQVLSERPRHCQHCGYAAHADAIHLRPVDLFPDDAPLAEINAPANLAYLCPNCRWEFEHGLFGADALMRTPLRLDRRPRDGHTKRPVRQTAAVAAAFSAQ